MHGPKSDRAFAIALDRAARQPLAQQIYLAVRQAIAEGRLAAGARLPSWRDLAAQLGVARGTVRAAYERLIDEQLVAGQGAAGTRVMAAPRPAGTSMATDGGCENTATSPLLRHFGKPPMPFQIGVPAADAFPQTLWSRLLVRETRHLASAPPCYPDPRGDPWLRGEIAAYLALARGVACHPDQIFITAGFAGALSLVIRTLGLEGTAAWLEEPGLPFTRTALERCAIKVHPVPVGAQGIDVEWGRDRAPAARLAVVTPGQQAPLGMAMSLSCRQALLRWAAETGAWILEDDYLGELQLKGRAAPALMSLDDGGRVLHAGTFSKTLNPALRLGFLVVPLELATSFAGISALLMPAPAAPVQRAVAAFLAEGHFLRHLRRMKRLYAARRDALMAELTSLVGGDLLTPSGGLAVLLDIPKGRSDLVLAGDALQVGLAPVPLSPWYAGTERRNGLLLCVTNLVEAKLAGNCRTLADLLR